MRSIAYFYRKHASTAKVRLTIAYVPFILGLTTTVLGALGDPGGSRII